MCQEENLSRITFFEMMTENLYEVPDRNRKISIVMLKVREAIREERNKRFYERAHKDTFGLLVKDTTQLPFKPAKLWG